MKHGMYTLDDANLAGKVIICRLDLNSPLDEDGKPGDITRIKRCLPTIEELSRKGARTVLMTHQGGDLEYHNYGSTKHHAGIISKRLNIPVDFIDDVCGPAAREKINFLKNGEVLMLDNVRYMAEELTLFETSLNLSYEEQAETLVVRKLSPLADLFACDAFAAAHRSQPTLVGMPLKLPSVMGRLFEQEMSVLSNILENPERPCTFILGGTKVEDAFMMLPRILKDGVADAVLTCGLVANIMYLARGMDVGKPSSDLIQQKNLNKYVEQSEELLDKFGEKIILPKDFAYVKGKRQEIDVESLPVNELITDIGTKTVEHYSEQINRSSTVFINGLAGVFEKEDSAYGTKALWEACALSGAFSVVGGGDSVSAANTLGLEEKFSYLCTGGGSLVRFLSGEELPVVKSLRYSANRYSL